MSGQNDHFAQKWFKVVMWHIIRKRQTWIFQQNHFRLKKMLLGATSGRNQFFWKILWWRHNHLKWPKLTKNIKIQLIEWNIYRKKQNQYAYAILKHGKILFLIQYPDVFPRQSGKRNHFCYFISIYAKLLFCFSLYRKLLIELPGPLITQTVWAKPAHSNQPVPTDSQPAQ